MQSRCSFKDLEKLIRHGEMVTLAHDFFFLYVCLQIHVIFQNTREVERLLRVTDGLQDSYARCVIICTLWGPPPHTVSLSFLSLETRNFPEHWSWVHIAQLDRTEQLYVK